MDIDLSILRMLEREKEISFDVLVEAIEQALLTAYHDAAGRAASTRGSSSTARPVTSPCWPRELDDEGDQVGRSTTTPPTASAGSPRRPRSRSCCSGCATPRTSIRFGEFSGKEGDIVSGIIQQGRNPDDVMVDLGKLEALLPVGERVPGREVRPRHRIKCLVVSVAQGHARPADHAVALPPQPGQEALRARGARDRRRHRRDRGDRPRGRPPHQDRGARRPSPGVNAKGACIGPMGQRVRNVMAELHGEKIDIVDWSEDPAELRRARAVAGPGHRRSRSST